MRSARQVIDPPLVYSTYLGGSGIGGDSGNAIAADAAGNAYIAGKTRSADFPVTTGVATLATGVIANAFVTKLNPTGTALLYSTFLGGSSANDNDFATGIAVDSSGDAYITGTTSSADFPTTTGSYRTTLPVGQLDS